MANEKYIGKGNSKEEALEKMYAEAGKKAELVSTGYLCGIKMGQDTIYGEKSGSYEAAIVSMATAAKIGPDKLESMTIDVIVEGEFAGPKPKPSGAAHSEPRPKKATSLF